VHLLPQLLLLLLAAVDALQAAAVLLVVAVILGVQRVQWAAAALAPVQGGGPAWQGCCFCKT
jgi:hypothetical protein